MNAAMHTPLPKLLVRLMLAIMAGTTAASLNARAGAQPHTRPEPVQPIDPDIAKAIDVTDAEAELRIQERLYDERLVTGLSTHVHDGVATLRGTVETDEDRRRAAALARRVEGVSSVINELEVDTTPIDDPPLGNSGGTLATAVAAELRRDPVLSSRDIRVFADQRTNTVTLTGEVASENERRRATQVAEDAFDVGHVRNRLQVSQRP